MPVLSSRVLLRPDSFERSFRFYREVIGLEIYREWGTGRGRGVVFFLGGGFLELSGSSSQPANEKLQLWLQVADLADTHRRLGAHDVDWVETPVRKPWGLDEMRLRDPDGVTLVFVEVPPEHPLRRRS